MGNEISTENNSDESFKLLEQNQKSLKAFQNSYSSEYSKYNKKNNNFNKNNYEELDKNFIPNYKYNDLQQGDIYLINSLNKKLSENNFNFSDKKIYGHLMDIDFSDINDINDDYIVNNYILNKKIGINSFKENVNSRMITQNMVCNNGQCKLRTQECLNGKCKYKDELFDIKKDKKINEPDNISFETNSKNNFLKYLEQKYNRQFDDYTIDSIESEESGESKESGESEESGESKESGKETEINPEEKTEIIPEEKTEIIPEEKTEIISEEKTEVSPEEKTEVSPEEETKINPEEKTEINPEEKTEINPVEETEINPEEKTEISPVEETEINPEEKTEISPEMKPLKINEQLINEQPEDKILKLNLDNPNKIIYPFFNIESIQHNDLISEQTPLKEKSIEKNTYFQDSETVDDKFDQKEYNYSNYPDNSLSSISDVFWKKSVF